MRELCADLLKSDPSRKHVQEWVRSRRLSRQAPAKTTRRGDLAVVALLLLSLLLTAALLTEGPAIVAFFVGEDLGISIASD